MAAAVLLAAIVTLKTTLISIVLLFVFSWEVLLALMTLCSGPSLSYG